MKSSSCARGSNDSEIVVLWSSGIDPGECACMIEIISRFGVRLIKPAILIIVKLENVLYLGVKT